MKVPIKATAKIPIWASAKPLDVPTTMDCPVCPNSAKKALTQMPGAGQARVKFRSRQASVGFDDAKTNAAALTGCTKNAGLASTAVGGVN